METDSLTVKEIKHIQSLLNGPDLNSPYLVGSNYFIRSVTHHYVGKLVLVTPKELVLERASWVADDGRFMNAVCEGQLNEIEPYPADEQVIIGRGAILDAVRWKFDLPDKQK